MLLTFLKSILAQWKEELLNCRTVSHNMILKLKPGVGSNWMNSLAGN